MSSPVLVLGNGGWGTALALVLERNGHDVRVWGHDATYTAAIAGRRENPKFLPGVPLPPRIRFGSGADELARGAGVIFSVVPTQVLRQSLSSLGAALPQGAVVVSCSKGFERRTHSLPSRIVAELLPSARLAVLSGPSHAEEVSRGLPAALVAASADGDAAAIVQRLLSNARFRVYTSPDPIGVEVGGAAKNVIAVAAGISDGLGFGDNARAALLTRGLHELRRLGTALGARPETFGGLAGMGDLIATCTSGHSRNRAVGLRIARGESLDAITRSTEKVAEGVETARSLHELSRNLRVTLPITDEVHAVLFQGKGPREAVEALMSRETRGEVD